MCQSSRVKAVNFCRQDKIVLAQAANGVRGKRHSDVFVAVQKHVRVMPFSLGDCTNCVDEVQCALKIFTLKGTCDFFAVNNLPAGKFIEIRFESITG